MAPISIIVTHILLFIALFFEVFFLITYLERRRQMKTEYRERLSDHTPSVTVIVPCFNEGETVLATIYSLLELNHPKDKLKIMIVNDGSRDNTLNVLSVFADHPQIEIHSKENGGKYTALNFALERVTSDLVGCLDADSFVDKDALYHMLPYFDNPKIMAVVPSIIVHEPNNILQTMQRVEYNWGVLTRKLLSYLDALYVTPGPFTIFRKRVFDELGPYKHAHHTEDLELALRMQQSHYKIGNSHRSFVLTVAPDRLHKLYKQRLRWTYGFIKNLADYKFMIFKKKYGHISFLILPIGLLSIFTILYLTSYFLIHLGGRLYDFIEKTSVIGFTPRWPDFRIEWFYVNTDSAMIILVVAFMLTLILMFAAQKLAEGRTRPGLDLVYYILIYPILVPSWIAMAVFNNLLSKKITWR